MEKKAFQDAYRKEVHRLNVDKNQARRNIDEMIKHRKNQQNQNRGQSVTPQQIYQTPPQLQLGEMSGLGGYQRNPQHRQVEYLEQQKQIEADRMVQRQQYNEGFNDNNDVDIIEDFTSPGKILKQNETLNFQNNFFNPTVLRQEVNREFQPKFRQYYEGILREEDRKNQVKVASNDLLHTNSFAATGAGGGSQFPETPLDKVDTTKDPYNTTDEENRYNKPEVTPVNIDSGDRDKERWPSANNYRIFLPKVFQFVKKIRITSSEIPNTDRVVRDDPAEVRQAKNKRVTKCGDLLNDANNHFYWINEEDRDQDFSCLIYDAKMTPGNYVGVACDCDETTIAEEIAAKVADVNRFSDGRPHQFIVDVDTTTNIVRILSIDSRLLELDPIITQVATNIIQVKHNNHPFSVGDQATILGSTSVGGIPAAIINNTHTVENVIDENTYEIRVNTKAAFSEEGGGANVTSGIEKPFKLLFSNLDTIGTILGFPQQDSSDPLSRDIEYIETNPVDLTKIDKSVNPPIIPEPSPEDAGKLPARIRTENHCLIPGDEILISDTDTIPDITGLQTVTKVITKDEFEIGIPVKVVNNQTVTTETRLGVIKRSLDANVTVVTRVEEQFDGCFSTKPTPHGLIQGDNIFIGNVINGLLKSGDPINGFHLVTEDFLETSPMPTDFLIESEILYEGETILNGKSNAEPFLIRTGSTQLNKITSIIPANNGRICPPFIEDPCCAVQLSRLYTGSDVPKYILMSDTDTSPNLNGTISVDVDAIFECGNLYVKCDPFWQSWTATQTGKLVGIYIRTGDAELDTTTQIIIYEGVGITGNIIATSGFADVSRDTAVGTYFCDIYANIEAGSSYTWKVEFFTDMSGLLVCGNEGNLYTEGESDAGNAIDYEFRTYVSPGLQRVDYYSQSSGKFDLKECICEVFGQNPNQSYLRSLDSEYRCIKDAFTFSEGLWRFSEAHNCLPGDRFYARLLDPDPLPALQYPLNTTEPFITPNVLGIQTAHDIFNSLDLDTLTIITSSDYRGSAIDGQIEVIKTNDISATKIQNIFPRSTSGYYGKDNSACDPSRGVCTLCDGDQILIRREKGNLVINKETDVIGCNTMANVYGCYQVNTVYSNVSNVCDDIFDLKINEKLALNTSGNSKQDIGECVRLDTFGGSKGQNGIFANAYVFFTPQRVEKGGDPARVTFFLDDNLNLSTPINVIPPVFSPLVPGTYDCSVSTYSTAIAGKYIIINTGRAGEIIQFWFQVYTSPVDPLNPPGNFSGTWHGGSLGQLAGTIPFADASGLSLLDPTETPYVTQSKTILLNAPPNPTDPKGVPAPNLPQPTADLLAELQLTAIQCTASIDGFDEAVFESVIIDQNMGTGGSWVNVMDQDCPEPKVTFINAFPGEVPGIASFSPGLSPANGSGWSVDISSTVFTDEGSNPITVTTTNILQDPINLQALCIKADVPHLLNSGDAIYVTTDPEFAQCNIGNAQVLANVECKLTQLDNSIQFVIPDETDAQTFKIFGTKFISGINNLSEPASILNTDPDPFPGIVAVNGATNKRIQFFYHKICGTTFNPIKTFFSNSQCGMIESLNHNVSNTDDIYIAKTTITPSINGLIDSTDIEVFGPEKPWFNDMIMWRDTNRCIQTANVGTGCAGEFVFPTGQQSKVVFDITEANDGLIFSDNDFQGGECLYFLNDVNLNNNFTNDLRENFFTVSTTNLTSTQFQLQNTQIEDIAPVFGNTFDTFSSTAFFEPGSYDVIVPDGVTSYKVILSGAGGGSWYKGISGSLGNSFGGSGSLVEGILEVVPGDVLTINVGEAGHSVTTNAPGGTHGFGDEAIEFSTSVTGFSPGGSWATVTELFVNTTEGFPSSGYFFQLNQTASSSVLVNYTGITPTSFTGCTTLSTSSISIGSLVFIDDGHGGSHNGAKQLLSCQDKISGTGGGASTDIRINGKNINNRVVVSAGGGGGGFWGSLGGPVHGGDGGGGTGASGTVILGPIPTGGTQITSGTGPYPGAYSQGGGNPFSDDRSISGGGGGYFGGSGGEYRRTGITFLSCNLNRISSGAGGSDLTPSGFFSYQGGGAPHDKNGYAILIPQQKIVFDVPGSYFYRIPNDTNSLIVDVKGAGGETANSNVIASVGGSGGRAFSQINLTNIIQPGDILQINVGGTGINGNGGYNGGGKGLSESSGGGGGGGGASDIRISPYDLADRIIIGGGGGGGSYSDIIGIIGASGGTGGGEFGSSGVTATLFTSATGGTGGTQTTSGTSTGGTSTGNIGFGGSGILLGNPGNKGVGGGGGGLFGGGGGSASEQAAAGGGGGSGFIDNDPSIIISGTNILEIGTGSLADANGSVCITITRSNDNKFGMGHFIQVPCGDEFNAIELIERKTNGILVSEVETGFPVAENSNSCVYDNSNSDVCILITDGIYTDGVSDVAILKDVIARPVPFPTPAPVFSPIKFETEILITPDAIEAAPDSFPLNNNKVDEISTSDNRFPGLNGLGWISDLGCDKIPITKILRDSTGSISPVVLDDITSQSLLKPGDSVFFISSHPTVPDLGPPPSDVSGLHTVRYVDQGNTPPQFFELDDTAILGNGGPIDVANATIVYFRSPAILGNGDGCITINDITEGDCPTTITATQHGFPVTIPPTPFNVVILDTQTNPPIDFGNVGVINNVIARDSNNIILPNTTQKITANGNVEMPLCPLEVVNLENLLIVQKGRWSKELLSTNCGIPFFTPDEANNQTIVTTTSRVNLKPRLIFELGNSIPQIGGTALIEVKLPPDIPSIPFKNGSEVLITGHEGGKPPVDGVYKIFAVTANTFKIQNNTDPLSKRGCGGYVTGSAPSTIPGHGLCDGYKVKFSGVMSEPDINDKIFEVNVIDENNFAIPVVLQDKIIREWADGKLMSQSTQFTVNKCPGMWCTNVINLELKDHGFANGDVFFLYGAKCLGGLDEEDLNTRHGNKIQNKITTEERLTRKIAKVIDDSNIQFESLDYPLSRTLGGGFDICISAHNHDTNEVANLGYKNYGFSAIQTNLDCNGDLNRFIDLDPEPYIFLTSDVLKNIDTTGTAVNNIFAKIQLSDEPGKVLYNTFVSDDLVFDNPIRKLNEIDFQFFRKDGKPFDFLGMDHAFTIEITEYKDRILGTNMQSRRGPIPDRGDVSQQGFVETTISSSNPKQNVVNPAAFLQQTSATQRINQ